MYQSLCVHWGGSTPSPCHISSTSPMSLPWSTLVTGSRSLSRMGYLSPRGRVPSGQDGGTQGNPLARSGVPHICSMMGGYVFTGVSLSTLGGTPSPPHNNYTGPMPFFRGTPSPCYNTSTGPMSFLGCTPVPGDTPEWGTPSQVRMGYPQLG